MSHLYFFTETICNKQRGEHDLTDAGESLDKEFFFQEHWASQREMMRDFV